jgi:hypothetical protein
MREAPYSGENWRRQKGSVRNRVRVRIIQGGIQRIPSTHDVQPRLTDDDVFPLSS